MKLFEEQAVIESRIIKRTKNIWGMLRGFCVGTGKKQKESSQKLDIKNETVAKGEYEIMPLKFKYGSVRYREKSNTYEFRYRYNGKYVSVYARTQTELREKYKVISKLLIAKDLQKLYLPFTTSLQEKEVQKNPGKITFQKWLDEWYKTYKEPKLKETSLYQIRNIIKNHIPDKIKNTTLDNLSVLEIQKSLNNNPSTRMAKYAFNVYTDALGWAFKVGKLKINIAERLLPVTHVYEEGKALTVEQREELEKVAWGNKDFYIFIFYLYTGCRPTEALDVTWQDVDFEKGTIHIPGTKTQTSDRTVPILDTTRKLLEKMKSETNKQTDSLFGFQYKALERRKSQIIEILGFEFVTKDLRTTFATMLEENGVSKSVIKRWMGHTSERTTNNYYIKVLPEFEKEEVAKLDLKLENKNLDQDKTAKSEK